jgi:hypothetical protein
MLVAAYVTVVVFAHQAEANSWNRFYNFLMFSTILRVPKIMEVGT